MIIVEGSDHVGKTTFCHKLTKEIGGEYMHMGKPSPGFDYFGGYLEKLRPGYVYDRFHYGAYVYGMMLGLHQTPGYSLEIMKLVSKFIRLRGGVIVVIKDSCRKTYSKRLGEKDELFSKKHTELANIVFSYIHLVDQPDFVFDIKGGTNYPDISEVVDLWKERNGS